MSKNFSDRIADISSRIKIKELTVSKKICVNESTYESTMCAVYEGGLDEDLKIAELMISMAIEKQIIYKAYMGGDLSEEMYRDKMSSLKSMVSKTLAKMIGGGNNVQ